MSVSENHLDWIWRRERTSVDERMEWDRGDEDTSPEPCENWAFAAVVGNVNDVGSVVESVSNWDTSGAMLSRQVPSCKCIKDVDYRNRHNRLLHASTFPNSKALFVQLYKSLEKETSTEHVHLN